jgi:hypothetical protein
MQFFVSYLVFYLLTLTGYLLGNATKEEHKELKKFITYFVDVLLVITYLGLFYFFKSSLLLFLLAGNLILKMLSYKYPTHHLKELHNIILLSVSSIVIITLYSEYFFLMIIPILIMFFEKSFEKFEYKTLFLEIIVYCILFLLIRV